MKDERRLAAVPRRGNEWRAAHSMETFRCTTGAAASQHGDSATAYGYATASQYTATNSTANTVME